MSGGFDTEVDGSPTSVRNASSWLRGSFTHALQGAADDVAGARSVAASDFRGQAGDAYGTYATKILGYCDEHLAKTSAAAVVFDAYADRLELCQDRMRSFRVAGAAGGLTVAGTVVMAPDPVAAVPAQTGPMTPQQQHVYQQAVAAHNAGVARVALYNQLLADATNEAQSFAEWIAANLAVKAQSFANPAMKKFTNYLWNHKGEILLAYGVEIGARGAEKLSSNLADEAGDLQRARRSGNPARRAVGEAPETPGRIARLLEESKWLSRGGKLLGPIGVGLDSYGALQSDHPAGGLIAVAAGTVGTVAVIALAPVEVPAAVVVGAGVGVGIAVTWGANKGWDALPDGFTDPVDGAVGSAWDHTKHGVSDGFGAVKSWL